MKQFLYTLIFLLSLSAKAQTDYEQSPIWHFKKADQLYNKNNCEEALTHINKTIAAQMDNWEAYLLRARIYECLRINDKAITDYSVLILWQPENLEFRFNRGELRYKEKKYDQAVQDLRKALLLPAQETNQILFSSNPGEKGISGVSTVSTLHAEIHNYIGLSYHELGKYDSALSFFTDAINLKNDPRYISNRALTYEAMELWQQAINDYERALQLNSENEIARYNLVLLYGKLGQLKKQKKLLNNLGTERELPEIHVFKGVNAYNSGNYKLAIAYYDSAIQLNKKDASYFIYRGQAYQKAKKTNKAISDYKQALIIDDTNPSTYFGLGNTYYSSNVLDSAKICYDLAILYDSTFYKAYLNRGIIYLREGKTGQACKDLSKAQEGNLEEAGSLYQRKCMDDSSP